jgi:hypothetical protein
MAGVRLSRRRLLSFGVCCRPAPRRLRALYRLIDAAYERRSLILTSNLHPARFDTTSFPRVWPPLPLTGCCTTPT